MRVLSACILSIAVIVPSWAEAEDGEAVQLREDDAGLVFECGDIRLATYHINTVQPPEAIDPVYARSGFVHPLRTPTGRVVTDDFSPDHPHQNGLFSTWVSAKFDGRPVDFWNRHKQTGTFRHADVLSKGDDSFTVQIEHVVTRDGEETVALTEDRTYRVSVIDGATIVDVHSIQRAATDTPLELLEYHYGGFAVRGARGWTKGDATMLTSDGLDRIAGNHSRPQWVAMSGPTPDGPATVVVISSEENFRSPQPVRLHPDMPYFCFAPCVAGPFKIERGRPLESRYRVVAFDGPPAAERIAAFADAAVDE